MILLMRQWKSRVLFNMKEEFMLLHEPRVILDDIILATVEKQSAVMKEEFTQGHEPKVILDDIINATVEKQSAVMKEEFTPGHKPN